MCARLGCVCAVGVCLSVYGRVTIYRQESRSHFLPVTHSLIQRQGKSREHLMSSKKQKTLFGVVSVPVCVSTLVFI